MKLSRPGAQAGAQQQQATAPADKPQPKGWGSKGAAAQEAGGQDDQRDRIQDKINPESNRSAFTKGTQEAAANIENGAVDQGGQQDQNNDPPAPRTRRRTAPAAGNQDTAQTAVAPDAVMQFLGSIAGSYFKLQAVKIASQAHFAESFESSADLFALSDEIGEYISKPF